MLGGNSLDVARRLHPKAEHKNRTENNTTCDS
jgi:hypothetical protein